MMKEVVTQKIVVSMSCEESQNIELSNYCRIKGW